MLNIIIAILTIVALFLPPILPITISLGLSIFFKIIVVIRRRERKRIQQRKEKEENRYLY